MSEFLVVLTDGKKAKVRAGHLSSDGEYVVLQEAEDGRTVAIMPKEHVMVVVDANLVSGALADS